MIVSKITPVLEKFTFKQCSSLYDLFGCIGYLRADLGASGKQFYSTWEELRSKLKTDEFRKEFDEVINTFRFDDKYDKMLSDISKLKHFCCTEAEKFSVDEQYYGIRVDTEKYTYLFRLNPNSATYNLYCYCYVKEALDRYLDASSKGIRFITSKYNEKFRIADGDKIVISYSDGTKITRLCRYYDDYHTIVGGNTFHICEFAELMEKNNAVIEPYKEGAENGD